MRCVSDFDGFDARLPGARARHDLLGLLAIGRQPHGLLQRSFAGSRNQVPLIVCRVGGHADGTWPRPRGSLPARSCGWRVRAPPAWRAWESARGPPRDPRRRPASRRARDSCPPASRPGCARAPHRPADRMSQPGFSRSKPLRIASGVSDEIQRRLTGLSQPRRFVDVAEDQFAFAALRRSRRRLARSWARSGSCARPRTGLWFFRRRPAAIRAAAWGADRAATASIRAGSHAAAPARPGGRWPR